MMQRVVLREKKPNNEECHFIAWEGASIARILEKHGKHKGNSLTTVIDMMFHGVEDTDEFRYCLTTIEDMKSFMFVSGEHYPLVQVDADWNIEVINDWEKVSEEV